MAARRDPSAQIEFALRRHFSAMFTEDQRAALVAIISDWDEAHPDLDRNTRTEGWLALAREALPHAHAMAASGMRG